VPPNGSGSNAEGVGEFQPWATPRVKVIARLGATLKVLPRFVEKHIANAFSVEFL
jgi:hypothetical protein